MVQVHHSQLRYTLVGNIVYDEHFGSIADTFLSEEKDVEIINCGNEAGSFLRTLEIVNEAPSITSSIRNDRILDRTS